jgi:hypothetical protein
MKMAWVAGLAFGSLSLLSIGNAQSAPHDALLALSKGDHTLAIVDPASLVWAIVTVTAVTRSMMLASPG